MNIPVSVKVGKEKPKDGQEAVFSSTLTENQFAWVGAGLIVGVALIGFAVGRHAGMKAGIKVGQEMGYAAGQLETFRIVSAAMR